MARELSNEVPNRRDVLRSGAVVLAAGLLTLVPGFSWMKRETGDVGREWGGFEVGEDIGSILDDISFVEIDGKTDNEIREKLTSKGTLSDLKYLKVEGQSGDSILPIAWGNKPDGTKWRASVWGQEEGKLVSIHNGDPKEGLKVVSLKPLIAHNEKELMILGPDDRSALFFRFVGGGWAMSAPVYSEGISLDVKGNVFEDLKQGGFIPTGLED